ncbi:MAG: hypothetical protein ACJAS9_002338 [Polaribacter sp.]|jgi:hypothetical protein
MSNMKKLNVFLTIDTELWLLYNDFEKDFDSAIYGKTPQGDFGVTHQLETFAEYGLNATFFVEPLFTLQYGKKPLQQLIEKINSYDQEVGLHIHTEWFNTTGAHILDNKKLGQNIKDYSEAEQTSIIKVGLELLEEAGAKKITSFRAGNYGGDFNTLKALHNNNLLYDTSYNVPYLNNICNMDTGINLQDATKMEEVVEYPVTYFKDYGEHKRHLQLTACSLSEIKHVLTQAYQQQRHSCTIVLHSFEWIKRIRKNQFRDHTVDKVCLKRFHKLCKFLSENKDKFTTQKFENINLKGVDMDIQHNEIKSNLCRTSARMLEQLVRRV